MTESSQIGTGKPLDELIDKAEEGSEKEADQE